MSITEADASHIVRSLRRHDLSAREVVAAHLERIDAVNPAINAVVLTRFDQALDEAAALDAATARGHSPGPLAGLPVTVKECFDVVGLPTTAGVVGLPRPQPTEDAAVVAGLRKAGAIVLGKTNLAQLSWALETDNPVYGRTNNPWDVRRTPGGSSGGEGAIVAAGGSPLGVGTDSGGSVRIPANFCGIHGFKPTSRRLSDRGTVDEVAFEFQSVVTNQPGFLARHVGDLRLVYEALVAGARPRAGADGEMPGGPGSPGGPGGELRVGFYLDDGTCTPDPEISDTVRLAALALERAGATVEELSPPGVPEAIWTFDRTFVIDAGSTMRRLLGESPRDWRAQQVLDDMPGSPLGEPEVQLLHKRARQARYAFAAALDARRLDVVICPAAPGPAPLHGAMSRRENAGNYTALYNLLGWPAGVVAARLVDVEIPPRAASRPAPDSRSGGGAPPEGRPEVSPVTRLPVGVQVAARPWREDLVLHVMERLETELRADQPYPLRPPL